MCHISEGRRNCKRDRTSHQKSKILLNIRLGHFSFFLSHPSTIPQRNRKRDGISHQKSKFLLMDKKQMHLLLCARTYFCMPVSQKVSHCKRDRISSHMSKILFKCKKQKLRTTSLKLNVLSQYASLPESLRDRRSVILLLFQPIAELIFQSCVVIG